MVEAGALVFFDHELGAKPAPFTAFEVLPCWKSTNSTTTPEVLLNEKAGAPQVAVT